MKGRNPTPLQASYPTPQDFVEAVAGLRGDGLVVMITLLWRGIDSFRKSEFRVDPSDEDIERTSSQFLARHVQAQMDGFEPYVFQHEVSEPETRTCRNAQSPTYDLAFQLRSNPRCIWPIEAKVLKRPNDTREYVKAIVENFLTSRYSPFSSEAAMLAYLLEGSPDDALNCIASQLDLKLDLHPDFVDRPHRVSLHERVTLSQATASKRFTCHHLTVVLPRR
jgi:hypothetical protein